MPTEPRVAALTALLNPRPPYPTEGAFAGDIREWWVEVEHNPQQARTGVDYLRWVVTRNGVPTPPLAGVPHTLVWGADGKLKEEHLVDQKLVHANEPGSRMGESPNFWAQRMVIVWRDRQAAAGGIDIVAAPYPSIYESPAAKVKRTRVDALTNPPCPAKDISLLDLSSNDPSNWPFDMSGMMPRHVGDWVAAFGDYRTPCRKSWFSSKIRKEDPAGGYHAHFILTEPSPGEPHTVHWRPDGSLECEIFADGTVRRYEPGPKARRYGIYRDMWFQRLYDLLEQRRKEADDAWWRQLGEEQRQKRAAESRRCGDRCVSLDSVHEDWQRRAHERVRDNPEEW